MSYLCGPLLLASNFFNHRSQSGESPPDSLDPSPWIRSSLTEEEPITDLISWMASEWVLLRRDIPLMWRSRSPFCKNGETAKKNITQLENQLFLNEISVIDLESYYIEQNVYTYLLQTFFLSYTCTCIYPTPLLSSVYMSTLTIPTFPFSLSLIFNHLPFYSFHFSITRSLPPPFLPPTD